MTNKVKCNENLEKENSTKKDAKKFKNYVLDKQNKFFLVQKKKHHFILNSWFIYKK